MGRRPPMTGINAPQRKQSSNLNRTIPAPPEPAQPVPAKQEAFGKRKDRPQNHMTAEERIHARKKRFVTGGNSTNRPAVAPNPRKEQFGGRKARPGRQMTQQERFQARQNRFGTVAVRENKKKEKRGPPPSAKRGPAPSKKQQRSAKKTLPAAFGLLGVDTGFTPTVSLGKKKDYMTTARFDSLSIDARTKRALAETLRYETMTRVQHQTLPTALSGVDLLAQAKTGTGKTLAFLIPAIERVIHVHKESGIKILVISPTRELANQICKEARQLLTFHKGFQTTSMVGGTSKPKDIRAIQRGIDLLVATPGRLIDHLENTPRFSSYVQYLQVLILDEADQMLEMGFRPDLTKIVGFLPHNRQSLLFSATMPKALLQVCKIAVKPTYQFINTIPKDDQQTHKKVPQQVYIAPMDKMVSVVFREIAVEMSRNPRTFKMMIFFCTARLTALMAKLSRKAGLPGVVEMHSRRSQGDRTRNAKKFRDGTKLIMFTSDVSARGVDYPDVSLIMQVGMTEREPYIHRIGRTARACSDTTEGRGVLVLSPAEEKYCLRQLNDLPLIREDYVSVQKSHPEVERLAMDTIASVQMDKDMVRAASQAYSSWLGYYNGYLKKMRWSKDELVRQANLFAKSINAIDSQGRPPALLKRTVGKMRLKGVEGLYTVGRKDQLH